MIWLLLIVTLLLAGILLPVGFVFGLLWCSRKWLLNVCIGIDQLGNVVCAELFNRTLIKEDGHKFGNPDETISKVLFFNCLLERLRWGGKALMHLIPHRQRAFFRY